MKANYNILQRQRYYLITLGAICMISLLLSARMIFAGDFFLLYDQARDFLLVRNMMETFDFPLIGTRSGIGGFFHGPFWLYVHIPFYILGGGSPLFYTHLYLIVILITVIAGYFVGSALYSKNFGILAAFLLAITPRTWEYAPAFLGVNMIPLVYLGITFFLIKYFRTSPWYFVGAAFFAGLTFQFETATALVIGPVLGLLYLLKKNAWKNYKVILISIVAFTVTLISFILFDLRHNFLMSKSVIQVFQYSNHGPEYLVLWWPRIMSHVNSLIAVFKSVLINPQSYLLGSLYMCIVVYGLYLMFIKKMELRYRSEVLLYIFFPIFIFLFYILYPYPIYIEYVIGFLITTVFLFALLTKVLWTTLLGRIFVILFLVVSTIIVLDMVRVQYFTPYIYNASGGSYRNQLTVVDWVFKDSKGQPFGYFVYTPETFTHGIDYLMWWRGKTLYSYTPQSKKTDFYYVIMYPPLSGDEGAHEFWKKHVIRVKGKVVEKRILTGNIVVEKISSHQNEEDVDANYHQKLIFR